MSNRLRVLVLENDAEQATIMLRHLRKAGFAVEWLRVDTEPGFVSHLGEGWDVILADYSLTGFNAPRALRLMKEQGLDIPFIVVTGALGEETAAECIKQGAADYLLKDRLARLGPTVSQALQEKRLREERQQAQQALLHSESQYRAMLNAMADAIHVVDRELRVVLFNDTFRAWNQELGLESHAVGKSIFEVFPFLPQEIRTEYDEVFMTGRLLVTEERSQLGGRELVTDTRKIPVFKDDQVTQVMTVVRDFTNREQSNQEREQLLAAEREQRLQAETLREVAAALIASLDPEEVLPLILEQLARVVSYDSASIMLLVGDTLSLVAYRSLKADRVPSTPLQVESLPHVQEVLQSRGPVIIPDTTINRGWLHQPESAYIRCWMGVPLLVQEQAIGLLNLNTEQPRSYTPRHAELAVAFANQSATAIQNAQLFDDLQRSHAALAVERGLLTQRVAQRTADLSAANAELARASRLKDEFLASMSHELRAPLNAILGFAQVLEEEVHGPLNERQQRSLRSIKRSGHHLLALINDILDVSKIEAGKLDLDISLISVKQICQASLQMVTQEARKKQIKVVYDQDDALSSPPQLGSIEADERRLKQILVNLLSNAVKFTPEGGVIGLEVVGDSQQEAVKFVVWDTGIGISEEKAHQLFQPFVQLDSSLSRQYLGTGLGLALVDRLTRLHGGGVSVESEVGQGSRFTISLPWRTEDRIRELPDADSPPDRCSTPQISGGLATILLAEGDEDSIETTSSCLQAKGYRVIVARTGSEVVQRAEEQQPDLVLMDNHALRMDGLELIRSLRAGTLPSHRRRSDVAQSRASVPIIVTAALDLPGDRERYLKAGASEYLTKPVGQKRLVKAIEAQISPTWIQTA